MPNYSVSLNWFMAILSDLFRGLLLCLGKNQPDPFAPDIPWRRVWLLILISVLLSTSIQIADGSLDWYFALKLTLSTGVLLAMPIALCKLTISSKWIVSSLVGIFSVSIVIDILVFALSPFKNVVMALFVAQFIGFGCAMNAHTSIGLARSFLFAVIIYGSFLGQHRLISYFSSPFEGYTEIANQSNLSTPTLSSKHS